MQVVVELRIAPDELAHEHRPHERVETHGAALVVDDVEEQPLALQLADDRHGRAAEQPPGEIEIEPLRDGDGERHVTMLRRQLVDHLGHQVSASWRSGSEPDPVPVRRAGAVPVPGLFDISVRWKPSGQPSN